MNTGLPILIFIAGVTAILILELRFKNHPITEAIRPWQSGLGALLGFVSLAISVQMNTAATQHSRALEQEAEGRQLALALHAEILPLLEKLNAITKSAATGSAVTNKILGIVAKHPTETGVKIRCAGGGSIIKPVQPIGVFDANKGNLGLLPGQLAYLFVDLHHTWRDLNEAIVALPEQTDCNAELQRVIAMVEVQANIVILQMRMIDAEYQRLRIPAAWMIRELDPDAKG